MSIAPEHLPRITLYGLQRSMVKRLSGFEKGHTTPQRVDDYHNAWIAKIADAELQQDLNAMTSLLRKELKYKRKDLVAGLEGNTACIDTPAFTYHLSVQLDPESPAHVHWARAITKITKTDIILNPSFSNLLGDYYQQTQFHTPSPVSIETLIDTLEENDVELEYPHDAATCTLPVPEIQGHILLHPNGFTIQYPNPQAPHTLLQDLNRILPLGSNQFMDLLLTSRTD